MACLHHHPHADEPHQRYLEGLTTALREVSNEGSDITTAKFTALCDHILTAFDHLGAVMYFAKMEMSHKNDSLKKVSSQLKTLKEVVEDDKKAGRVAVKNSCTRNLHRLMLVISFLRQMLDQLLANPKTLLKDAFYKAYMGSLAPIHTYVLQTAVWAALGLLPTKDAFLKSIGETQDSAKAAAAEVGRTAGQVVSVLEGLFAGMESMPISDVTYVPVTRPAATG